MWRGCEQKCATLWRGNARNTLQSRLYHTCLLVGIEVNNNDNEFTCLLVLIVLCNSLYTVDISFHNAWTRHRRGRGREVFTFDFVSSKIQIIVYNERRILVFALSEAPIVSPFESTDQLSTMCTLFHSATETTHNQLTLIYHSSHSLLFTFAFFRLIEIALNLDARWTNSIVPSYSFFQD